LLNDGALLLWSCDFYSRALLHFLRYPGFGGLEEQYSLIIQSGLARILDLVKTAPDTSKLDQISLLEAIKVFSSISGIY
jgi:hypothetical protein